MGPGTPRELRGDPRPARARQFLRAAALVAGIVAFAVPGLAASSPVAKIVSATSDRIVLTVAVPPYDLETVEAEGRVYTRIMGSGLAPFARGGQPDLPVIPVLVALPPGAEPRLVSVERSGATYLDGVRVVPVESFPPPRQSERVESEFADFVYAENDSIYGAAAPFPAEDVWLADRGKLRHQEVVKVLVAPFTYEPARERVAVVAAFTIVVAFEGVEGAGGVGREIAPVEDGFEGVYRGTVVNYEQGRRWRVGGRPMLRTLGAPQVENQRVKIEIDSTGFYALSYDTLASLGFPSGVAVDEVLVYRDVFTEGASETPDTLEVSESAINVLDRDGNDVLSSGDAVEFFAEDFYDQFGYQGNEDAFSTSNVYWLSWSAGDRRRIASRPGWRDAAAPEKPTHFQEFIHVEQDSYFVNFPPQADMDVWIWTRQRRLTPFALPGIDVSYGTTLTVRLVTYLNSDPGTTMCPRPTNVVLYMTGCDHIQTAVDTVPASLGSVKVATVEMAAGVLCETGNVFRFESSLAGDYCVPGNTLDWFEITYQRTYVADRDVLLFTNGDVIGEVEYEVAGLSTSDVRLYDVTDPYTPAAIDLGTDQVVADGGTFTVVFRDSVSGSRQYLALGGSQVIGLRAASADLKQPPRTRGSEADYLVVSYPDFAPELAPLVAKREEQGHTVLVATPEEVYDDYANGLPSDVAIRRFIRDRFYDASAEFVLLVGDANSDHRGLLLHPPASDKQLASDVDYVPTHLIAYAEEGRKEWRPSDNWYVMVGGSADTYPDLYLGRLPAGSSTEAATMVDKILRFENYEGDEPWRKRVLLVADDKYKYMESSSSNLCNFGEYQFMAACDSVAALATRKVAAIDTVKYYLDRCVVDDQPDKRCGSSSCCTNTLTTQNFTRANCTPDLVSLLNDSALLVNYQGHASRTQFTHENLVLDHGYSTNPNYRTDIRDLSNADKPFIFMGYGCWISEFVRRTEPTAYIQDAIGEKFLTNSHGGACAAFASGCSEGISSNQSFNPYVARAMFGDLQAFDPHGDPVAARILIGEVVITALTRFSISGYATRHLLFGDPAMVVDMGAPTLSAAVDGVPIDETYVFAAEDLDSLEIVFETADEEAIMEIGLDLVEGTASTPVAAESYVSEALTDSGFVRSRSYRTTYTHVPLLGDYAVRLTGEDYSGREATFDVRVNTGTASFYRDQAPLSNGDGFVFGQTLSVVLMRPYVFGEDDITALVDTTPASSFDDYSLVEKDADGRQWEISLLPTLTSGSHTFTVSVKGFTASRTFEYLPVSIDILAGGRNLFDGDFVAGDGELQIVVLAEPGFAGDDIGVRVDDVAQTVEFEADTSGTRWTGTLGLAGLGLAAGDHEVAVEVEDFLVTRAFRISEELALLDVSVFPNPFGGETYFYYTLTEIVDQTRLAIYTIAGRKVFEDDLGTFAGYNQYRWDGRDSAGDRLANGAYLYKVSVKSARGEREFVGRLVKIE
jgi:hypothetical protein